MAIIYWLTGAFALAALVCVRSRAAAPGMFFTALTIVLLMITPVGHDIVGFLFQTGSKIAEGGAK
jgi:hypothetical protein